MKKVMIIVSSFVILIIGLLQHACKKEDNEEKSISYGQFTDSRDGQTYKTIVIGSQTWMAENLCYETSSGSWVYDDDSANAAIYGRLYNWGAASAVCPDGWHLPGEEEWDELIEYLGGDSLAGGKMKVPGTTYWYSPNTGATNSSGFTALPGGCLHFYGSYGDMGNYAYFWTSTEYSSFSALFMQLNWSTQGISISFADKSAGLSVRCIQNP